MHTFLLAAFLVWAAPPVAPARQAKERVGIKVSQGSFLRLNLGAGVLVDSNPTNTAALEYWEWSNRRPVVNLTSPAVGVFLSPGLAARLQRRRVLVEVNALARAWTVAYVAQGGPPWPSTLGIPTYPGRYFPQGRLALDLNADAATTLHVSRTQDLITQLRLLRTTSPSPELLGTMLGRTTGSLSQAWAARTQRGTWNVQLQAGVRADLLDNLSPDARTWRALNKDAPPVYLGGLGATLGGTAGRSLGSWGAVYARAQTGASAFLAPVTVLSVAFPTSLVLGWFGMRRSGAALRVEAGLWVANTLCPQSLLETCRLSPRPRVPLEDGGRHLNLTGTVPIPVGMIQWDQPLGRRWLMTLKASKDARGTLLYAYVDEKRLDDKLTALLLPTLQTRPGAAASLLSYGAVFDRSFSRNQLRPIRGYPSERALELLGRQDVVWSADGAVRWAVQPWLVLSLQQTFMVLMTSVQVRRADGAWQNPGLVRSQTAATILFQW